MSTIKRITILTFICFFSVFLFACSQETTPKAYINNFDLDNGEITFEVDYDDPYKLATFYEVQIIDEDDNMVIRHTIEEMNLGVADEIFVDELRKDTTYRILVISNYVFSGDAYTNEVLAEFSFTTSTWNNDPVFVSVPETVTINEGESFDIGDINITAVDEEDGDLSEQVTLNLPDTASFPPGTYTITVYVQDSNNRQTSTTLTLIINDTKAPKIEMDNPVLHYTIYEDVPFIMGFIKVTDTSGEIIPESSIDIDTSAVNMNEVGTYTVTVTAEDSSGNIGSFPFPIIIT